MKRRLYLFLMLMSFCRMTLAATTQIDTVLNNLLSYVTSGPAHILALLAIVGAGFATFRCGRLEKDQFVKLVLGVGIIFGATDILRMLGVGT